MRELSEQRVLFEEEYHKLKKYASRSPWMLCSATNLSTQ